jgi:hypothetical protein
MTAQGFFFCVAVADGEAVMEGKRKGQKEKKRGDG